MLCTGCKNECNKPSNGMCCICQTDEGQHLIECEICIPRIKGGLVGALRSIPRPKPDEKDTKPDEKDTKPEEKDPPIFNPKIPKFGGLK